MDHSREDQLRDLLSDIQITYFEFSPTGESLVLGLNDFSGNESRVSAEGIFQFSISRVPGDSPPFAILECEMRGLAGAELEKLIPGYGFSYVRWPATESLSRTATYLRLTGDIVIELTCVSLERL